MAGTSPRKKISQMSGRMKQAAEEKSAKSEICCAEHNRGPFRRSPPMGLAIKVFRHRAGMSQWQLADKLGVTPYQVAHWETEEYGPSAAVASRIAQLFETSVEEMARLNRIYRGRMPHLTPVPHPHLVKSELSVISHHLVKFRQARGLTQQAVADRAGTSRGRISEIELCKTHPTMGLLTKICAALRVKPAQITAPVQR